MKLKVINLENKDVGEIDLDDGVFAAPIRKDLLARMINYQLAKRRQGTHKTKTRGEINGSTARPLSRSSKRVRAGHVPGSTRARPEIARACATPTLWTAVRATMVD